MKIMTTMGERLAWARNQLELILQQVSDRSGLAVGYISQLEKGAKVNPTVDALSRLTKALGLPLSFVLGEANDLTADEQGTLRAHGRAEAMAKAFGRHLKSISYDEHHPLARATTETRFIAVVEWLTGHYKEMFTESSLAFHLGLSVRALQDILERNCEAGPLVLNGIATMTGIPLVFFTSGQFPTTEQPFTGQDLVDVVNLANEAGLSPAAVKELLRSNGKR